MYRCELSNTIMLERNRTKHNQTKKQVFFESNIQSKCYKECLSN